MPKQVQAVRERISTQRITKSEYQRSCQPAEAQGLTVSNPTKCALEEYCETLSSGLYCCLGSKIKIPG